MLLLEDKVCSIFEYKKLSPKFSQKVRDQYKDMIPSWLPLNGAKIELFSWYGTLMCVGYDRIVIGDYGAFIEIPEHMMMLNNIHVPDDQKFRFSDKYKVKYHWYTANDSSEIKVYHQQGTVVYADYKIGYYYISPFQIKR